MSTALWIFQKSGFARYILDKSYCLAPATKRSTGSKFHTSVVSSSSSTFSTTIVHLAANAAITPTTVGIGKNNAPIT